MDETCSFSPAPRRSTTSGTVVLMVGPEVGILMPIVSSLRCLVLVYYYCFGIVQYRLTSRKVFDLRKREPQGRLTLLCSVVLNFALEKDFGGALWGAPPDPKEAWKTWTKDFLNSRLYDLRFPALRELTLDFLEMKLNENEGFRVSTQSITYSIVFLIQSGRALRPATGAVEWITKAGDQRSQARRDPQGTQSWPCQK